MKKLLLAMSVLLFAPTLMAQEVEEDDVRSTKRIISISPDEAAAGGLHVRRRVGSVESAALPHTGTPRIPVVLVDFSDRRFQVTGSTPEEVVARFKLFFNGEDNAQVQQEAGNNGSVRSYFIAQSDSTFRPEFHILGPVTLDQSYAFYGKNSGSNKNSNITAFYKETLTKVVSKGDVDWSLYDNDQNGNVDMVFFIYAGWGENTVSDYDPDAIWPHEYAYATSVTLDSGERITFACMGASSEARYKSGSQLVKDAADPQFAPTGYNVANLRMDGVGTSIHELSHALGLPDLYDTRSTDKLNFGMDAWSIMDYGCYTYGGRFPCQYTAYERDFMQWQMLEELTEPAIVTLQPYGRGGCGYKIVNDENPLEYYILENRQAVDWDTYTCERYDRGLMVTHVDYDRNAWNGNRVNSTAGHPRMTIIAANNRYIGAAQATSSSEYLETLQGNLFPFAASYQDLTDETTPASVVYAGGLLHKPLRGIKQNDDGSVTLCFRTHGLLEAPLADEATDIEARSFVANWQTVENATRYVVELYREDELARRDTLTSNLLRYEDQTPSTALKYRVMALAESPEDYLPSPWSEFSYLETLVDALPFVPMTEGTVDIYSLSGMKVATCAARNLHRLSTLRGVYILRDIDGQARKVLIK